MPAYGNATILGVLPDQFFNLLTDPTQDTAIFQQPLIDMNEPVITPEPSMRSPAVAPTLLLVLFSVVRSRQKLFPTYVPKYQTIA